MLGGEQPHVVVLRQRFGRYRRKNESKAMESVISMNFSKRTEWDTEESDLAQVHRERLAASLPIADLTASNPTRCGFDYPGDLLAPLTHPAAYDYDPNPRGSLRAREAICRYYHDRGVRVGTWQVIITTSTSEAYSYLFKLL